MYRMSSTNSDMCSYGTMSKTKCFFLPSVEILTQATDPNFGVIFLLITVIVSIELIQLPSHVENLGMNVLHKGLHSLPYVRLEFSSPVQ